MIERIDFSVDIRTADLGNRHRVYLFYDEHLLIWPFNCFLEQYSAGVNLAQRGT